MSRTCIDAECNSYSEYAIREPFGVRSHARSAGFFADMRKISDRTAEGTGANELNTTSLAPTSLSTQVLAGAEEQRKPGCRAAVGRRIRSDAWVESDIRLASRMVSGDPPPTGTRISLPVSIGPAERGHAKKRIHCWSGLNRGPR